MFNPSFEEKNSSLTKFEEMLKTNQVLFFDAVEFENIIHYYIDFAKLDLAKKALKNLNKIFQIVLIDPPYNTNITEKCLFKLKELNLINQDSYIFAESSKAEDFNYDGYQILDIKIFGGSKLTILRLLCSSSFE